MVADPAEMYSKDIKLFEQYYDYYIYNRATAELNKVKLKDKDVLEALGNPTVSSTFDLRTALGVKQAVEVINK
jgi:outer membrane protein assembly factor BamE (lipoprotein component of BamABCDE complex)